MDLKPSLQWYQVILLGDPYVGITSFYNRCSKYENKTNNHHILVGGSDWVIYQKYFKFDGNDISFYRWQTWGDRFDPYQIYYQSSDVALIFFDLTNKFSFLSIKKWIEEVKEKAWKQVKTMIIGTKSDLTNERVVSYEEGKSLADEIGIMYLEVSSKTNKNIKIAFNIAANLVMQKK
ncbi:ryh1_1 [Blepharisma stoltei]|uniref:Uncharacterized protein n=1 Tax=Blepharisma stoltei TaxID=1481888 RepID=A0AAU9J3K8_9CILI|nr:unnamed protein product [Blepharisma stoltei]